MIEEIATHDFEAGDKVKLITNIHGDHSSNPVWRGNYGEVPGTIRVVDTTNSTFNLSVLWDNGERNSYNCEDLELLEDKKEDKMISNERLFSDKITITAKELGNLKDVGGQRGGEFSSPKEGILKFACSCGRKMTAHEDTLKSALRIEDPSKKDKPESFYLEGTLYKVGEIPKAGEIVFVVDNTNGHSYPLGTLIIFGADVKESKGLYMQNGVLRTGNNLPPDRIYKPTKVHKDLVSSSPLMLKLLEAQGAKVFGKTDKETVPRKTSRKAKTKVL